MRAHECHHHTPDPQMTFEHLVTQLQAAVSQSINGVTLRGSLPAPFGGSAVKPVGSGTPGRIMSIEARETTTTNPIVIRFYDGPSTDGRLLATIPLAAGAGTQRTYPGTSFTNGLTVVFNAADGVSAPLGICEGVVCIGAAAEGS